MVSHQLFAGELLHLVVLNQIYTEEFTLFHISQIKKVTVNSSGEHFTVAQHVEKVGKVLDSYSPEFL